MSRFMDLLMEHYRPGARPWQEAPREEGTPDILGARAFGDYADTQIKGAMVEALAGDVADIGKGWASGLWNSFLEAGRPPKTDYSGEGDRAMALLNLMTLGAMPEGSLGALIGRKALTFPEDKFMSLVRKKAGPEAFRDEGFEIGIHGNIQKPEPMPDFGLAKVDFGGRKLEDVLRGADPLFEAYPDLAPLALTDLARGNLGGAYHRGSAEMAEHIDINPELSPREFDQVLRHELQHAIQKREEWPGGSNPQVTAAAQANIAERLAAALARGEDVANARGWAEDIMSGKIERDPEAVDLLDLWMKEDPKLRGLVTTGRALGLDPQDAYMRVVGEIEARAAQRMGPQQPIMEMAPGPKGWSVIEGQDLNRSRPIYDRYVLDQLLMPSLTPVQTDPRLLQLMQILEEPR